MIRTISVQGLGPHENTTIQLDPKGRSDVTGPSEIGKSQLVEAVCFAFFGVDTLGKPFDATSIRDGMNEAAVELTLANGVSIFRSVRLTDKGARVITRKMTGKDGETHVIKTEKDWLSLLAEKRFPSPQLMRLVMAPFAWIPLAHGEGDGRPLRDALTKVLPKADLRQVIAELMKERNASMMKGDPISEARAKESRLRANKERDEALGKVHGIKGLLDAGADDQVEPADDEAIKAAHSLSDAAGLWSDYDDAHGRWEGREEQRARQEVDLEEWRERAAALGDQPDGDAGALQRAREAEVSAVSAYDKARKAVRAVEHDQFGAIDERATLRARDVSTVPAVFLEGTNGARRRLSDAMAALESGDVCPTCKRDGWESRVEDLTKERAGAEEAVAAAETAIAAQRERLTVERDEALVDVANRLQELGKEFTRTTGLMETAESKQEKARAELAQAIAANVGATDWERAKSALGDEPPAAIDKEEAPAIPAGGKPTDEAKAAALATLEQQAKLIGKKEQRSADTNKVQAGLTAAEHALEEAKAEAARLDVLVDCVRAAPSVAIRRQLAALGDLGCVSLELPEGGGCLVRVDGRRWSAASTGRQVVADALFRAGIRRAMKTGYLQIFVDLVSSVGGQPAAPIADPVVLLRTNDSDNLEVL